MKILASVMLILLLALSQTAFAQGLPKNCFNEIMAITEKKASFDLQSFSKDLAVEVVKVKAQLKLPFGKPADSKMTDIGMTVGCLKNFPDNPAQILPLLKDIGTELAKREASKLGAKALAQGTGALAQAAGLQPQAQGAGLQPQAQGLPKNCFNEIMAIVEKNASFDLQNFSKDLAIEVVKVKAQLKFPFGKPADSKMTDMGMTVGCLKDFPDNPAQILPLLKDIGIELAKREAGKLGAKALAQGTGAPAAPPAPVAPPAPPLKECDAVFNTEKKFCYDGEIYDKCDGISYNPTTHICTGDVANRAMCDSIQYNPLVQKCENNALLSKCGETYYNPKTHGCKSGEAFAFPACGEVFYNPETHGCGQNSVLLIKCDTLYYNPAKYGCENGVPLPKCGEALYNHATHGCSNNAIYPKCGEALYNPATHGCINNTVYPKCGEVIYNPNLQLCNGSVVVLKETEKAPAQTPEEPKKPESKVFSLGFRTGLNFSHVYEESYDYGSGSGSLGIGAGFLAGLAFDIAPASWFHFQPGIVYIQKGAYDSGYALSLHYVEFPVLISLKFSAVRLNAGPYFGLLAGASHDGYSYGDFGISYGGGFDIENFYIGIFYDYGMTNINDRTGETYNRTVGLSLGVNL